MSKEYRVFVHLNALDILPKSGKRRSAVIDHLQNLGQIAHLGCDYEIKDPDTRRPFDVTEVAGYAITWWIDAPVGEVKVVDITSANRLFNKSMDQTADSSASFPHSRSGC